jgi:hypothetical protein
MLSTNIDQFQLIAHALMQTAVLTNQNEWGKQQANCYVGLQRTNARGKRKIMFPLCDFTVSTFL